jgi:hypothetical protein
MTSRRTFISILALAAFGGGAHSAEEVQKAPSKLWTIEDVKKSFPFPDTAEWKEATVGDRKLLFCLVTALSFDVSNTIIIGWRIGEFTQQWGECVKVITRNTRRTVWDVDSEKAILSVRGADEDELKGIEILHLDLRGL